MIDNHLITLEVEVLLKAPIVSLGVSLVRDVDLVVVEGEEVVRVRPRPRPRPGQQLQLLVAGVVVLELVTVAGLAPAPRPLEYI